MCAYPSICDTRSLQSVELQELELKSHGVIPCSTSPHYLNILATPFTSNPSTTHHAWQKLSKHSNSLLECSPIKTKRLLQKALNSFMTIL